MNHDDDERDEHPPRKRRDEDARDDEDDRPRRRRRRRDDDDDYDDREIRRDKKSSNTLVIVLVIVGVAILGCGGLGVLLLIPAVSKVREAAGRMSSTNNLKQMTLAIHSYNDANRHLPTAAIYDKNGKPLLSWRVAILPYIEQNNLYTQFKLDEPWDGPNNRLLLSRMPKTYSNPIDPSDQNTPYRVFTGKGTIFEGREPLQFSDIKDGTNGTILIVEAAEAVPWTKPDELEYTPNGPLPALGSKGTSYVLVAMADGSVRTLRRPVSDDNLRAGIVRNDGRVLADGE